MSISHLNLPVRDLNVSLEFYRETLGFSLVRSYNEGRKLVLEKDNFHLFLEAAEHSVQRSLHFGFLSPRQEILQLYRLLLVSPYRESLKLIYHSKENDFLVLDSSERDGTTILTIDLSRNNVSSDLLHKLGRTVSLGGTIVQHEASSEATIRLYFEDPSGWLIEAYEKAYD